MKTLDQYIDTPGFYLSDDEPADLIVVTNNKRAVFLRGELANQEVNNPEGWNVQPVKMKRFYASVKPTKRQIVKMNPL